MKGTQVNYFILINHNHSFPNCKLSHQRLHQLYGFPQLRLFIRGIIFRMIIWLIPYMSESKKFHKFHLNPSLK